MQGIYFILNIVNHHLYVGSAKNFITRAQLHFNQLATGKHHSIYLQNAYNKYGRDNFKFAILELVPDREKLLKREQYWIDLLEPEYNIAKVAGSSLGIKRRPETLEKLRQSRLGAVRPQWVRDKISQNHKSKRWVTPPVYSEESRKKMSDSQKRLYADGYVHPRKGVKESIETVESKRQRVKKPILQYSLSGEFIKEWASALDAKQVLNIHNVNIGLCCNGKRKTAGGFIWKFKEN
jgi:group I intron endonuclease